MTNPFSSFFKKTKGNPLHRISHSAPGKLMTIISQSSSSSSSSSEANPLVRARSYMKLLSMEVILHILRYMSARELCIIAAVSMHFRECALDKSLWRSVSLHSTMEKSKLLGAVHMMSKLDLFTSIRVLSINNDHISPSMVEHIIQSTPNLREIKFNNVRVTEKMAKLLVSRCPSLEQVYMEGGRTDDECLELLSNGAIKLKSINLHKVQNITTTGICHVIKNTNLAFLNFNGISGWDIRSLAPYCSHFTSMDLGSSNNLIDDDLKSLTKTCKKLVYLSLKNCKMITNNSMKELIEDCPQLTELNMSGCTKLTNESVKLALQNFHQLSALCLSNTKLTSPIPFPRFPYRVMNAMQNLDLSFTDVKDEDLRNLVEFCPNLRVLKIAGCTNITDEALIYLANNCPKLAVLDISRDPSSPHRMLISLAAISELAKRENMYKLSVSYSSRNKITTQTLHALNIMRTQAGIKAMAFHLNDAAGPAVKR